MTRLIGYNALWVALATAVFGLVAIPLGVRRVRRRFIRSI